MNETGHDYELIDEAIAPGDAEQTGRPIVLTGDGPATPATTSRADSDDADLNQKIEVLLAGGCREVVVQGYDASVGGLPSLTEALALLPAGPGTLLAPEVVTSTSIAEIATAALTQGKVYLANGASGASDSTLTTLSAAVIAEDDCRFAGLWADWITYSLTVGTVNLPATFGVAAAIARNDEASGGNVGLAPTGKRGVIVGAQSVVGDVRSQASRNTLNAAQVNTVKAFGTEIRNDVERTLADLEVLPAWKLLGGSRVAMAIRATFAALSEETHGDQLDGNGITLDRIRTLRDGALVDLWRKGALYGATPADAFRVEVGPGINPLVDLQEGRVRARTTYRVSPSVEHTLDQTVRRPITTTV